MENILNVFFDEAKHSWEYIKKIFSMLFWVDKLNAMKQIKFALSHSRKLENF
ncbi:MAG: hypothetical protein LBU55_01980 [Elusimicrobiota bacterium]|jgi:hypothetical protein|nr:hypothetical protein [Elusimicrobiota bacterium]